MECWFKIFNQLIHCSNDWFIIYLYIYIYLYINIILWIFKRQFNIFFFFYVYFVIYKFMGFELWLMSLKWGKNFRKKFSLFKFNFLKEFLSKIKWLTLLNFFLSFIINISLINWILKSKISTIFTNGL
jgi:hypothetical protein